MEGDVYRFSSVFTNVFGLSFADAAVLMLVARMFDVVTDPLMGTLADRTQSRFGTYRPWLIYGAIPFGLIFALLLYTPDFGPVGKRIYAYALYLLMMAVYTMVNVPYGSLLGVMTEMMMRRTSSLLSVWWVLMPWDSSPCFLSLISRRW